MRKLRKLRTGIALLVTAVLMLSGCSQTKEGTAGPAGTQDVGQDVQEEQAKGRFIETEIALPEKIKDVIGVKKCDDGSLLLFGYDENYVSLYRAYSGNRGEDWDVTELEYGNYRVAAIGEDGSAALLGYCMNEDDRSIMLVDTAGKTSYVHLSLPDYEGDPEDTSNMIVSAIRTAGKLLVVDFNKKIYEVDTDSGKLIEFSSSIADDVRDLLPLKNRFAALTANGVQILSAENKAQAKKDDVFLDALGPVTNESDSAVYSAALTVGENEDEIYFANHEGIFFHKQGGSTVEQLANGELLSIGDTSMSFWEIARFDDGHFMIFAVDSLGNDRCFSYAFDADASAVPEKMLTVYALEDSTVLQQLAGAFQKEHPDVFVKKTIGMSKDNSVTAEDAIKTLNTEIMAGNGPDVLVLDGLPAESYIEKGILSDISAYVEEADASEGLFTNITDAYKKDGKIYQVPLRFYCAAAEWGDGIDEVSGSPKQIADQISLLKEGSDPVLAPLAAEMFLYTFYDAYSASWRMENGIDAAALEDCLAAAKTLYDMDGYEESERYSYGAVSADSIYQGQIIYGTIGVGSANRIVGMAKVSIGTLCGVDDVRDLYGKQSVREGTFGLLHDGDKKAFVPFVSLGLAASAEENELAQAFIRTALSSDGQYQMTAHFSVNRKALENECKNAKAYSIGSSGPDGQSFGYEVLRMDEKQEQALTEMLESLNAPMWSDRVVQDLFIGEGKKYMQGELSLEDAVSAITKKIQLYVAE